MAIIIGLLTIELYLPEAQSLKDKRAVIKSLLKRIQNTHNTSVAEVDFLDKWQRAAIAVAVVANDSQHVNSVLQNIITWIETNFPQVHITQEEIEIL